MENLIARVAVVFWNRRWDSMNFGCPEVFVCRPCIRSELDPAGLRPLPTAWSASNTNARHDGKAAAKARTHRNFELDLGYGCDGGLCYGQDARLGVLLEHNTGVDAVRPCRACTSSRMGTCQKRVPRTGNSPRHAPRNIVCDSHNQASQRHVPLKIKINT